MTTLKVRFWGARGSHPVSGERYNHFGGNTLCVEIEAGDQVIILDAGTGIIELGRDLMTRSSQSDKPIRATILFSHMHHDHTQGFPFFTPAYIGTTQLDMFGPGIFAQDLEETLAKTMLPPVFPISLQELPAVKNILSLQETDVILLGDTVGGYKVVNRFHNDTTNVDDNVVQIKILRSYAHPGGVLIYRIDWQGKSVVYATDTEGYVNIDQRLVQFARDADVLIHDAQYTEEHYLGKAPNIGATQGWGHSTPSMACDVAQAANVKQLILFHHDPRYADDVIRANEATAQALFANSQAAYQGLTLVVGEEDQPDEVADVVDTEVVAMQNEG